MRRRRTHPSHPIGNFGLTGVASTLRRVAMPLQVATAYICHTTYNVHLLHTVATRQRQLRASLDLDMVSCTCCMLRVACCMLYVACCMLHVACSMLHAVCCEYRSQGCRTIERRWLATSGTTMHRRRHHRAFEDRCCPGDEPKHASTDTCPDRPLHGTCHVVFRLCHVGWLVVLGLKLSTRASALVRAEEVPRALFSYRA